MSFTLEVLPNTRAFFKQCLTANSLTDLNTIPQGFNNNIIWNIGHVVVTQQLLLYKLSGLPMQVSQTLIDRYKKGSKPEKLVSQQEVDEIKTLLHTTLEQLKNDYTSNKFKQYTSYTVSTTGNTLTNIEEALQFVLFHEGIHLGYVMALIHAVKN